MDKQVVVITGSGMGIGKAIAERLGKDGFKVVVSDINEESANRTSIELIEKGIDSIAIQANVSKKQELEALVEQTVQEYGQLDVFVNNAGIDQVDSILNISEEDLQRIFEVNVFGTLYGIQAAAVQMKNKELAEKSLMPAASQGTELIPY